MKKYVFESLKFFCAAILCTILSAFATPARAALPTGYTELQYIESTGTQYIDTGVALSTTDVLEIEAMVTNLNATKHMVSTGGTTDSNFFQIAQTSTSLLADFGSPSVGRVSTTEITSVGNKVSLKVNAATKEFYVNNNLVGSASDSDFIGSVASVKLFSAAGEPYIRTYSFKIVGKINLIPARRNSDNVLGMYDTVNNRFYTNAGTGEFVAGPDACDGTVVNYTSATGTVSQAGTPTPTNPIDPTFYKQGNMVLRDVGNYKDSYDATTGKITRRVGVKVLDGTEGWSLYVNRYVSNTIDGTARDAGKIISSHFEGGTNGVRLGSGNGKLEIFQTAIPDLSTAGQLRNWLAEQYAAGTPVMLYYPLLTETTEDWTETSYCFNPIKIATTKYNETAFGPLNTALQNAISVVDTVVSNTITQAGRIATLQAQKQTRPNDIADDSEKCPAGKKCLLVEDASGVPHWYEIVESVLQSDYTQLEYVSLTGSQYIDTGLTSYKNTNVLKIKIRPSQVDSTVFITFQNPNTGQANIGLFISGGKLYYQYGASDRIYAPIVADTDYVIEAGNGYLTVNGTTYTGSTHTEFTINSTLYVGVASVTSGAVDSRGFRGNIYYYRYEDKDGNLLFKGTPAKNSSGVIGMYDTVSGQFFMNAGSGEFVAGDPVAE